MDDAENIPVEGTSGLFHAALRTTLGKRLAWKASTQNVMLGYVDHFIVRIVSDVTKWVDSPIPFVDRRRRRVDLNCIYASAPHGGKRSVKTTNSRKEVDESECGSLHDANLDLTSDVTLEV